MERDFAFVVDRGVQAQDLIRVAQEADRELVESATVFDIYEGQSIGEGRVSLAISVRLQPRHKTLTEGEIETFSKKLVTAVESSLGGTLRA